MSSFRILAAVDLAHPDNALGLLEHVRTYYSSTTEVHVVHVLSLSTHAFIVGLVPRDMLEKAAKDLHQALDRLIVEAGLGGKATAHLLRGDIAGQIVAFSRKVEPHLMVLNAHRTDASITSLGSNAAQIVRNVSCSVLVRR